jgi:predicted small lipoprotein YifL
MTVRLRIAILLALAGASSAGCGQRGPLVLPQDARPIERVDPPVDSEQTDDERQDEP